MVSFAMDLPQADDDRHSTSTVASTVATTTSLASRIASLAIDFGDKLRDPDETSRDGSQKRHGSVKSADQYQPGMNEEEEEIVEITEEEMMQMLDSQEPALQVCCRLFTQKKNYPIPLKRLTMAHVEEFRQHGYVVIDGFLAKDLASKIHADTMQLVERGQLQDPLVLAEAEDKFIDRSARGDKVMWLNVGQPPTDTTAFSPLMVAFQELQDDLHEIMKLRQRTAEYQLGYYAPNGAAYVKHRDAFPDDGSEEIQRRVTAICYCNDWEKDDGGVLRVWPPSKGGAGVATRRSRSPTGSEAGTSYSEVSDSGSMRSHLWGAGSTTSSMFAEASLQHEHETTSVDGVSVASDAERLGLEWVEVDGEMVLEVAPIAGRMVLMLSGAVDHAVMPSFADRVAVTAWCQ